MFEELVGLIDKIKDDSIGEWTVDKENDGTFEHPIQMPFVVYSRVVRQFERVVYNFEKDRGRFSVLTTHLVFKVPDTNFFEYCVVTQLYLVVGNMSIFFYDWK